MVYPEMLKGSQEEPEQHEVGQGLLTNFHKACREHFLSNGNQNVPNQELIKETEDFIHALHPVSPL